MQNSNTIKDINPIMLPIIYEISFTLFISYIVPSDGIALGNHLCGRKYHYLFIKYQSYHTNINSIVLPRRFFPN